MNGSHELLWGKTIYNSHLQLLAATISSNRGSALWTNQLKFNSGDLKKIVKVYFPISHLSWLDYVTR